MKHLLLSCLACLTSVTSMLSQPCFERLGRGLIALSAQADQVYVSWRMLIDDAPDTSFDLYRQSGSGRPVKLNKQPITRTSDFVDKQVDLSQNQLYLLHQGGKEVARFVRKADAEPRPYLGIPLNRPPSGVTPDGECYTYTANDASVGDLDGDGAYEIILKWEPDNSKRPPQTGFTGPCILDAYKLNGRQLWRIDLGRNIRAGAAYTQFLVMDFDGDGRSELCCKTADGTVDGLGHSIGQADADWRRKQKEDPCYGKIVDGPEYITVFDGATGRALDSQPYIPTRYPLDGWGGIGGNGGNDATGGRSDRFTAGVALLDGKTPAIVMVRGWYGRTVLAAWEFEQGKLLHRWTFDSALPRWKGYSGMANHSLTIADFDADGFDEICVGGMTVDHNGAGLYTTGLRHGDALHAGDLIPGRPGIEVFGVHESEGKTEALLTPGVAMFDGKTGEIIWSKLPGVDVGRGVSADIDPRHEGAECWGPAALGLMDCRGNKLSDKMPGSCNFTVYWDADSQSELLDKTSVSKWNVQTETTDLLFQAKGVVSNNGTKANPGLCADILGDWREEVLFPSQDQTELRIYSTTIPAVDRKTTLMHNRSYRLSIAWQNVGYNQPAHIIW